LPEEGWQPLAYVAQRQAKLPPEERTQYLGQEVTWEWTDPATGVTEAFRRLYVRSSEERATCRKVRSQQLAKAAAELEQVAARVGKRTLKTQAQVECRLTQLLKKRRVEPFVTWSVSEQEGTLRLGWAVDEAAVAAAARLDGYYVLLTSWSAEQADARTLLCRWKGEWQIERRFSDWKGPLQVRPVFVTSNRRMAALVLLLHLALLIYSLMEREARRALAREGAQKVSRLLAGHVDAIPTGENILLAFEHLFLFVEEKEHGRAYYLSDMFPEQEALWRLLGIQMPSGS
jgi:hypothetical protein